MTPLAVCSRSMAATSANCSWRPLGAPGRGEQVAELCDEVREWRRRDGAPLEPDRLRQPAAGRLDSREAVEGGHVAGERGESGPERVTRLAELAEPEVELSELDERPGGRLGRAGGIERQLHRLDGGTRTAAQLTGVSDAGVAGERGLDRDHAVEGPEGLVVAAELEERVADEAVAARGVRRSGDRSPGEPQGLAKLVAARRERREAGEGDRVAGVAGECAAQRALGEGVDRRRRPSRASAAGRRGRGGRASGDPGARPSPPPLAGAPCRRCPPVRSRRRRDPRSRPRRAARRHDRRPAQPRAARRRAGRPGRQSGARRGGEEIEFASWDRESSGRVGRPELVGGSYGPPMGPRWTCSCA